jgi:ribonucleoside-diphosphate reductase alpha chain
MPLNRTQIARAIFSAAESMGISDRKKIEGMIDKVIERLEQRSLPGMEDLVAEPRTKSKHLPGIAEIQSMVKDILAKEEQEFKKENQPEMHTAEAKPRQKPLYQVQRRFGWGRKWGKYRMQA